jgi:hypothetical protein
MLDVFYLNDKLKKPVLIKLDVQEFELQVIEGGKSTISEADFLIVEVFSKNYMKINLYFTIYMMLLELFILHIKET